jgi:ATP-dependent helicase/nuclease subunit A
MQAPRPAPLSPSAAFDEAIGRLAQPEATATERQSALARGRLVHRLLQSLPDIPAEHRRDAGGRYLGKAGTDFSAEQRADILRKALAILDDKNFAALFASGSRAEVPIVGRIIRAGAEPILVSGQVDRLAVTAAALLIADYKSDRSIPAGLDEVEPYVAQLALYGAVLARLYPDKTVRAALVFTEGPLLLEVSTAAMQAALGKFLADGCKAPAQSRSIDPAGP